MLAKFLLVGTGGSGGKTLSVIRESLDRRLRYAGWTGPFPDAWQFVWIDTITSMPPLSPFGPLPTSSYLGLVAKNQDYDALLDIAITNGNKAGQEVALGALGGWVPPAVPLAVANGAGQSRAIGRAISAAQMGLVRERIAKSLSILRQADTDSQLNDVALKLGIPLERGTNEPAVQGVIVGSSAGGTGSGIFMDIAEAMMSAEPLLSNSHRTILYAPDVFDSLAPAARGQVQANALGTISEVISGTWSLGVSPEVTEFFKAAGVAMAQKGFGPKRVYLMGSSNAEGVSMGDQDDVYAAAGEALAAVITSSELQNSLLNERETNAFDQSWQTLDETNLKTPKGVNESEKLRQPLSSIGFSRISLGVERLGDFIAESVGTAAVRQMLWPDYEPQNPQHPQTPTELVDERVATLWGEFLANSGLNERDPANDIVDALKDPESESRIANFAANAISFVGNAQGKNGLAPGQWVSGVNSFYLQNRDSGFISQELAAINSRAQIWSREIETKIVAHVATSVARHGLKVTLQLVTKLKQELLWVSEEELGRDVATKQRYIGEMAGAISQALTASGLSALVSGHPSVADAANKLQAGLRLHSEIARYQVAVELSNDLSKNLLQPLENALTSGLISISDAVNNPQLPDGTKNTWKENALLKADRSTIIPARFQSSATEMLLIEPNTYPEVIEEQIRQSISELQGPGWLEHTILRALLGVELADPITSTQSLLSIQQIWNPAKPEIRGNMSMGASVGKYSIESDPWKIIDTIGRWIVDPQTTIGKFLLGDIAGYLDNPDVTVASDRVKDFNNKFKIVVSKSAPLAKVDSGLANVVHKKTISSRDLSVSRIPFDQASPIGQNCLASLGTANYKKTVFQPGAAVQEITIFEALDAMSPVVFDSLMQGVATNWNTVKGDYATRNAFWTWRRTLPLLQSLPASFPVIEQIVRGWFVAFVLGQVKFDVSQMSQFGAKVEVWDEDTNVFTTFPYPFLGRADERFDFEIITSVLASLPIALVEVNASRKLDALRPYWRLSELGNQGAVSGGIGHSGLIMMTDGEGATDNSAGHNGSPISRWITSGTLSSGMPIPSAGRAGPVGAGLTNERKAALLTQLEEIQNKFADLWISVQSSQKNYNPRVDVPQSYEMKHLIDSCLKDVISQVQSS